MELERSQEQQKQEVSPPPLSLSLLVETNVDTNNNTQADPGSEEQFELPRRMRLSVPTWVSQNWPVPGENGSPAAHKSSFRNMSKHSTPKNEHAQEASCTYKYLIRKQVDLSYWHGGFVGIVSLRLQFVPVGHKGKYFARIQQEQGNGLLA
jgi:hypothetical protein